MTAPAIHAYEDQQAELAALRRVLSASAGCFSLSIAICNTARLRNYVIDQARRDCPTLTVVHLPSNTIDVYGAVAVGIPLSPTAIFITDLEGSILVEDDRQAALRSLNAGRELWEQSYRCPVVFWIPEFAATLLAQQAPDFWRYRSHQFDFTAERANTHVPLAITSSGDLVAVGNLPAAQKEFRIAELNQRLAVVGHSPPPDLLVHATEWAYELAHLYSFHDEGELASEWYRIALRGYGRIKNRAGVSATLHQMGMVAQDDGDYRLAERLYRRALATSDSLHDHAASGGTLCQLGTLAEDLNDGSTAERLFLDSMSKYRLAGTVEGMSGPCHNVAALHYRAGNLRQAKMYCDWSLRLASEGQDQHGLSLTLQLLGTIERDYGNVSVAARSYSRSINIRRRIGDRRGAEAVETLLERMRASRRVSRSREASPRNVTVSSASRPSILRSARHE